ncbi:MAG TPA: hypothetical protein DCL41_00045 [Bdellovibrionales bacterium]|nr:hypothetical protein [Pseudobdellovibrionaceae bacterium]HAG90227.1 hypothetical protein [Bdellovibrionales bacterium]
MANFKKDSQQPYRIVLTGGPGAGKTTAADLIRREIGDCIIVVPEAATMLFEGGFPRYMEPHAQMATQKAIYHVQRNLEDVQSANYPDRILLCDRGTIDSTVYWPNGMDHFFESLNTSLEEELNRYDAVVFFETAAVGNISIESNSRVRTESLKEAVDLDRKLRAVWGRHSNFHFIPHNSSFIQKLLKANKVIQDIIQGW